MEKIKMSQKSQRDNLNAIQKYFPEVYFERGMDYYKKGLVCELDFEADVKNIIQITSSVSGSHGNTYTVKIKYKAKGSQADVDGMCTCPMRYNCKHVAATMIAFLSQDDVVHEKRNLPQLS